MHFSYHNNLSNAISNFKKEYKYLVTFITRRAQEIALHYFKMLLLLGRTTHYTYSMKSLLHKMKQVCFLTHLIAAIGVIYCYKFQVCLVSLFAVKSFYILNISLDLTLQLYTLIDFAQYSDTCHLIESAKLKERKKIVVSDFNPSILIQLQMFLLNEKI